MPDSSIPVLSRPRARATTMPRLVSHHDASHEGSLVVKSSPDINTWYSLAGGSTPNHLSQTTAANKPHVGRESPSRLPLVDFNGSSHFMEFADLGLCRNVAQQTWIMVAIIDAFGVSPNHNYLVTWSKAGAGNGVALRQGLWLPIGSGTNFVADRLTAGGRLTDALAAVHLDDPNATALAQLHVWQARYDHTGDGVNGRLELRKDLDAWEVDAAWHVDGVTDDTNSNVAVMGAKLSDPGVPIVNNYFNGGIGEFQVANAIYEDNQMDDIAFALIEKWGVVRT